MKAVLFALCFATLLCVTLAKKPKKFTDYSVAVVSGNQNSDYQNYLQKLHPGYQPDAHNSERVQNFQNCYANTLNHDPDTAGYSIGLTHFCHWTKSEFQKSLNNRVAYGADDSSGSASRDSMSLEHEFDHSRQVPDGNFSWVTQGAVSVVKNQLSCGSCYTFAAAAALEGAYQIKYGILVNASTQQYVDCSAGYAATTRTVTSTSCSGGVCTSTTRSYQNWVANNTNGNNGCNGGTSQGAWAYNNMTGSFQNSWECYPFTSGNGVAGSSCLYSPSCSVDISVRGYVPVPANNETALMQAVSVGPVACAIDSSTVSPYTGGVFTGNGCSSVTANLNHAITVVGYGTLNGVPFWQIKNSWGPNWGVNGFLYLYRGNNTCGIAAYCAYPVVN